MTLDCVMRFALPTLHCLIIIALLLWVTKYYATCTAFIVFSGLAMGFHISRFMKMQKDLRTQLQRELILKINQCYADNGEGVITMQNDTLLREIFQHLVSSP